MAIYWRGVLLPLVFDRMELQGRAAVCAPEELEHVLFAEQGLAIDPTGSGIRTNEMPLTLDVMGLNSP